MGEAAFGFLQIFGILTVLSILGAIVRWMIRLTDYRDDPDKPSMRGDR